MKTKKAWDPNYYTQQLKHYTEHCPIICSILSLNHEDLDHPGRGTNLCDQQSLLYQRWAFFANV